MKTVITNCNLIDGTGADIRKHSWVLIKNDLIIDIGQGEQGIPEADAELDAKGKFLLPGLVNLHVHIQRRHLARGDAAFRYGAPYIENSPDTKRILWAMNNAWHELSTGVTTIRDLASKNRIATQLRDAINEGIIKGPRMIVCGFGIAGTGGHETHRYQGAVEADGPDEVRKAVRAEIKAGADFIKLMASGGLGGMPEHEHPAWDEFSVDEITVAVEEAHKRKKGVTVHAMGEKPVLSSLYSGVDGIEHGTKLNDEALDIMVERGIYYVPTMSGIAAVANKEERQGSPALAELMRQEVVRPHRISVKRAFERGILIGCGTDTLGDMVEEMKMLQECGVPAIDCIKAATLNGAKIIGLDKTIGTVEFGKKADLVLIGANPIEDLDNMNQVDTVFLNGNMVTAKWLCGF